MKLDEFHFEKKSNVYGYPDQVLSIQLCPMSIRELQNLSETMSEVNDLYFQKLGVDPSKRSLHAKNQNSKCRTVFTNPKLCKKR